MHHHHPHRHAKEDTRNLIVAVLVSGALLFAWNYMFPPHLTTVPEANQIAKSTTSDGTAVPEAASEEVLIDTLQALETNPRVQIENANLTGSINVKGARFDNLILRKYRVSLEEDSEKVTLLAPSQTTHTYFAEMGWTGNNVSGALPNANTVWQADYPTLTPEQPVTLTWNNNAGLEFAMKIALDKDYMFTVTRSVTNRSGSAVTLSPYALINRSWEADHQSFAILHEGPFGVFNGELQETEYKNLQEDKSQLVSSTGGWIGISDKYWFTALVPQQQASFNGKFQYFEKNGRNRYQVDYMEAPLSIAPDTTASVTTQLFAGAKELKVLDAYTENQNIPLFDRALDFGVLYFLTKPIFIALQFFYSIIGNFGLAILLLTVLIKALLFPLANKSYIAMGKMKELQPKMVELRKRCGDDRVKMQQEMMELYRKEKVNPASGCLPLLIQIPIFFALYKVLFVTIEMRHAPFYGWIQDLSAQDPTNIFTLFGAIPWDPPSLLHVGIWPLIMTGTMILQQRLQPTPPDPTQAKVIKMMPYLFLFMFAGFPAGLVLYWAWNNTLSIIQQTLITRKHGKHS